MKRKNRIRSREDHPVFFKSDSPFLGMSKETIDEVFRSIGRENTEALDTRLKRLSEILIKYDVFYILGVLAAHGPIALITSGDHVEESESKKAINQQHIEFLLGMVLGVPQSEIGMEPVPDEVMNEVWETLPQVFSNFGLMEIGKLTDCPESEKPIIAVQEWIRTHTLSVRNWGTPKQVKRICTSLYLPLSEDFKREVGFTAQDAIIVFSALVDLIERRLNFRREKLGKVLRLNTKESVLRAYEKAFPEYCEGLGEVSETKFSHIGIDEYKYMLVSYLNYATIANLFVFSEEELINETELDGAVVHRLFEEYSSIVGSFKGGVKALRLDNPIWDRPLIRVGDGVVFAPVPYRFFHDPKRMIERLTTSQELKEKISKRRAKFLESEVESLFRKYLPGATVYTGVKFKFDGEIFETDLIVQYDTCLFVVESKSRAVSASALRGAPERMRLEIERLIVAPSIQSQRLLNLLIEFIDRNRQIEFLTEVSGLNLGGVKRIARLSVTLDDFATLQSQIRELQESGFCSADVKIAPTMILADLEMVFDILLEPAMIVHYLFRRGEVNTRLLSMAHEAEWLQFYLNTGFNVGDMEDSETLFMFPYGSKLIDQHYHLMEHGVSRRKPRPRVSKFWLRIISQLRERCFDGWTEAAFILLSCSLEEQDEIEAELVRMKKYVPRFFNDPDHRNSILVIPRKARSDALVFVVLVEQNYHKRQLIMENVANHAFEVEHIERCLVVCKRVNSWSNPYDALRLGYSEGGESVKSF